MAKAPAQSRGRNKYNSDKPSGKEVKERWTSNTAKSKKTGKMYGSPMKISFPKNKGK